MCDTSPLFFCWQLDRSDVTASPRIRSERAQLKPGCAFSPNTTTSTSHAVNLCTLGGMTQTTLSGRVDTCTGKPAPRRETSNAPRQRLKSVTFYLLFHIFFSSSTDFIFTKGTNVKIPLRNHVIFHKNYPQTFQRYQLMIFFTNFHSIT